MSRFNNIKVVQLKFRVKFKGGNRFDAFFDDLVSALIYRNKIYASIGYPKGVMLEPIPETRNFTVNNYLNDDKELIHNIQINTFNLKTHLSEPITINVNAYVGNKARLRAKIVYEQYASDMNKITALYNRHRFKWFDKILQDEIKTQIPHIPEKIEFDYDLWSNCYLQLHDQGLVASNNLL